MAVPSRFLFSLVSIIANTLPKNAAVPRLIKAIFIHKFIYGLVKTPNFSAEASQLYRKPEKF